IKGSDFEAEVLRHPQRVLVDFYADWCFPCRALAPRLEQFSEEHADTIKVVKIDSDADEDLSTEYGVRTIPTVIAFENGQEVNRVINPQSRAALEGLLGKAATARS
ncbi:MAG: thioredoxin, partial [Armatimonadetes bacterium]|nr:thioredoxin [Armatimonadota bacterium]